MDDLSALQERLRTQRPVSWEQLPDFPLYMDQVLSYMERQILRFEDGGALTSAMVNNYTKSGLVPRTEGKKYSREHLAYLTVVCILKRVMSSRDMELTIGEELRSRQSVRQGYEAFRDSLDKALNLTADEMRLYENEDAAADAAVHFALLSYAAGLASSRYVSLLREKAEAEAPAPKGKRKSKEKRGTPAQEVQE